MHVGRLIVATPSTYQEVHPAPAFTTIKGAATMLGVHADTIRRLIYANKLPHVKIGRAIRIPVEALTVEALKGVN